MRIEQRIRHAEGVLFARYDLDVTESFVDLSSTKLRLRVLSVGSGPDLVFFHGVTLSAAVWAPWLNELKGYRALLVELPGHGLSDPFSYQIGSVRGDSIGLLDDIFAALGLVAPSVVGHSLGGMFALWYAAARPGRIASLVAIGDPGAAFPGVQVKMPLSLLTVPGVGPAVLSSPTPRSTYRRLLGQGLSPAAARTMPNELVDVLRFASRRKGNPPTVASLMHAIDGFRRPRPETLMTDEELARIDAPTLFCWGQQDPFLSPEQGRPSVAKIAGAVLHEVDGGHGPWFEDPVGCANVDQEPSESNALPLMQYPDVSAGDSHPFVRSARPDEFTQLRKIEFKADQMFASVGIGPFVNDEVEDHLRQAVLVLVVGDPPQGFVCVELVDGIPHIWQLSVDPEHGRQGLGRALVEAACDWGRREGFGAITLTTYRDVPWNGPFYASLGFSVMETLSPGLVEIRQHERAIGDDDFGPRVAMRRDL